MEKGCFSRDEPVFRKISFISVVNSVSMHLKRQQADSFCVLAN